jgi:flagellar protein FlaG
MSSIASVNVSAQNFYTAQDVAEKNRQVIADLMPRKSADTNLPLNSSISKVDKAVEKASESVSAESEKAETKKSLPKAVSVVTDFANMQNLKLQFTAEEHNGSVVVQVVDQESKKVIRQIPSKEFLEVAEKISDIIENTDQVKGLLFESKV